MKSKILDKILISIEKAVKKVSLRELAQSAAERVRTRTRLGYGVHKGKRGGKKVRLKKLTSEQYKKARKKSGRLNRTITKPNRSNLTFTGQLLDAIVGRVRNNQMIVEVEEGRDDGVSNSDIIRGQADQGRYFFELTDKEVKGLRSELKKSLIKSIKKRR